MTLLVALILRRGEFVHPAKFVVADFAIDVSHFVSSGQHHSVENITVEGGKTNGVTCRINFKQSMRVIKDPLGQTHSPACSNHYSRCKDCVLRDFGKLGRTDNTYEYSDHYQSCVGQLRGSIKANNNSQQTASIMGEVKCVSNNLKRQGIVHHYLRGNSCKIKALWIVIGRPLK